MTTPHDDTKHGNQYFYQVGLGRNILTLYTADPKVTTGTKDTKQSKHTNNMKQNKDIKNTDDTKDSDDNDETKNSKCSNWIFALMVEADGQYSEKDKINGIINPNSGGNVVFITPSLWISSKKLILQFGIGFPVVQDLYGNQNKMNYGLPPF